MFLAFNRATSRVCHSLAIAFNIPNACYGADINCQRLRRVGSLRMMLLLDSSLVLNFNRVLKMGGGWDRADIPTLHVTLQA